MNTVCHPTGLLASRIESSHHSVSNHPPSPSGDTDWFLLQGLPSRKFSDLSHPHGRVPPTSVGLRLQLAGSPRLKIGRIEFVLLRTDGSPSVAPHPASQRRSNRRIQAPIQSLTRTSTSLIQ